MTKNEALRMALEAIEYVNRTGDTQTFDICYAEPVITAIIQALEQPDNYKNSTWTSANWNDDFFEVVNPHKKDEVVRVYHDYWREKNT